MTVNEALVQELDKEREITQRTLQKVPQLPEFRPHSKSMPLGKLAAHVAQLPEFGITIMTTPQLDFATADFKPLPFESAEQLSKVFDASTSELSRILMATADPAWNEHWELLMQGQKLFAGTRFLAYRQMFLNHMVHHRAQLGVYLRLNDLPVPGLYGPSNDEPFAL